MRTWRRLQILNDWEMSVVSSWKRVTYFESWKDLSNGCSEKSFKTFKIFVKVLLLRYVAFFGDLIINCFKASEPHFEISLTSSG